MSFGSRGRRFVVYQLPALCWAALLFVASSVPQLPTPDMGILSWDKTEHFGAFGILGFLALRAIPHWHGWALLISILWAALDELHQAFVPGRDPNPYDFLADVVGIGVAYLIFQVLLKREIQGVWIGRIRRRDPNHPPEGDT